MFLDASMTHQLARVSCCCVSLQLQKPDWKPNYGPREFVPNWGATIVGARKFLIAYNINMLATKEQAHRIALNIREQGRGKDQVNFSLVIIMCIQAELPPHKSKQVSLLVECSAYG